jgi:saccharopine dehydrogenase-like NADP-dependent oxidoreductase
MPERIPASGTVHWVGTGLSTGAGLAVLAERADQVHLWGRTVAQADACAERLQLTGRVSTHGLTERAEPSLGEQVAAGDVVVSMLPATEHLQLLRLCIDKGAHFACSSYASEPMLGEAALAEKSGIVVLTEAGLDPGLDHVLAHLLIGQGREELGERAEDVRFTSYCGGIPAEPNEFRYRFSWAPRGVLTALLAPSRYLEDGETKQGERAWLTVSELDIDGETFEVYPNRDSMPFVAQYEVPSGWQLTQFVRGTLRLAGWRDAWQPIFQQLPTANDSQLDALAADLAARYPTTEADADRVVLAVELTAQGHDGQRWSGQYLLDLTGDASGSAMARTVSLPLAFGVLEILAGTTPAGLHRAAQSAAEARRWLEFLAEHGVEIRSTFSRRALPGGGGSS